MAKIRRIEIETWVYGGNLYAVSTKVNGKLMETVTCPPARVFDTRDRALETWAEPEDIVHAGAIPEIPTYQGSERLFPPPDSPIVIFNLLKLTKAVMQ
jgi:hypothetical protein